MAKTQKVWIEDNAIDGSKIRLNNDEYVKARNAANSADVNIVKINSSDEILFASTPKVGANLVLTAGDKGVANGVASLDGSGRIPSSQLPTAATEYKGTWNASTNSPSLADGTGNTGDFYIVATAGSQNLGSGAISFAIGDWAFYNGSTWEKVTNSNSVASVNGQTGVVVLSTTDIGEGTNQYFTEARVRSSVLTGFTSGAGAVSATDSVLSAIQKLDGNINAITPANSELEVFVLTGSDITNGYVDLQNHAMTDSLVIWPKGGPVQQPSDDYSINYTGGVGAKTRVIFAGDLASTLVAGHKLNIKYLRA